VASGSGATPVHGPGVGRIGQIMVVEGVVRQFEEVVDPGGLLGRRGVEHQMRDDAASVARPHKLQELGGVARKTSLSGFGRLYVHEDL